jgi:uncharacterized NAD(P)/FAD-binding protein YdhS
MQSVGARDGHKRIIIIGGGASGVLLACHILRRRVDDLGVTLIERRRDVGRGIAYHTANPDHLLNVRAANMSAFPDQPDHFWRWFCARQDPDGTTREPCDDPFCFVPRKVYGSYIASLLAPFLCEFERPGCLRIIQGECVSVDQEQHGIAVTLADGLRHHGDFAVLATGHEATTACKDCYVDPWTPPSDAGVGQESHVLILGTGLTMVDYVVSLILGGHKGPITALSRHGLLPHAHRRVEPFPIDRTDVPFGADVVGLVRWLRNVITVHARQGGDWRSVIDGIRPFTQQIWQELSIPARRRFLQHIRAWWDVHRHRMAPEVENRINAAISSGHLTVIAAKLCNMETDETGGLIRYRRRGGNVIELLQVDKIVDCRGIGAAPFKAANPVLRSLLDRGVARLDPLLIGLDVTSDCAVINAHGIASDRLFAVGPLTKAAFWEIIAIPDIRNQCVALADRLLRAVHGAASA